MIRELKQVMVYVDDVERVVKFWEEQLGFVVMNRTEASDGSLIAEIAPHTDAETSIVLFSKSFIRSNSPELELSTPSLMFSTNDLTDLHEKLTTQGVPVGQIVDIQGLRTFNFSDPEENYFAVTEESQVQFD